MSWFQDVRYGSRLLVRSPAFTAPVLLVLALGIGANVAVFSLVRDALFTDLPYPDTDRLVVVWSRNLPEGHERFGVSSQDYRDWAASAGSFERLSAYQLRSGAFTGDGAAERIRYAVVTPGLLRTLGVAPTGRDFGEPREAASAVLISHAFWTSRFAGNTDVLGRVVRVDGHSHTVVGILPATLGFPFRDIDVWLPLDLDREVDGRGARWLSVIGRLTDGATLEAARAEMAGVASTLAQDHPETNAGWETFVEPLHAVEVADIRPVLLVIWGSLVLVLLLVCANLANLLLVRAHGRSRELAVRAALGAGRARLMRQLFTESVLLAFAGGLLALPIASLSVDLFARAGSDFVPRLEAVRLDASLLAFTLAVTVVTGLVFGLLPAWSTARDDLYARFRSVPGSTTGGSSRVRSSLVAVQTALALIVLIGAGLLLRSFAGLLLVDPGFDPEGLLTLRVEPTHASAPPGDGAGLLQWYRGERARAFMFYRDLVPRLEAIPGVTSASAINRMPITGSWWMSGLEVDGRRSAKPDGSFFTFSRPVLPGYFQTMATPILSGRAFDWSDDAGAPPVAIVNQTAARTYWPGEEPLGKRLRIIGLPFDDWITVVGVVADVRLEQVAAPARPTTYYPMGQSFEGFGANWGMDIVLRADTRIAGLADQVRRTVHASHPELPVFAIRPMRDVIDTSLDRERLVTLLLALIGGLTLVIATAGVYSMVAFSVSLRRRELGVRLALGATPRHIYRLVLGGSLAPIAIGLAAGTALALPLTPMLETFLYDVTPTDARTYAGVGLLLATTALVAAVGPTRVATRLDVTATLRQE